MESLFFVNLLSSFLSLNSSISIVSELLSSWAWRRSVMLRRLLKSVMGSRRVSLVDDDVVRAGDLDCCFDGG